MKQNRESLEAYALAGLGLAKGIYSESIGRKSQSSKAWLAMGAGILAYEIKCEQGELLSEGADRAIEKHPILTRTLIGYTALHLANSLPEKADLFHQASALLSKTKS